MAAVRLSVVLEKPGTVSGCQGPGCLWFKPRGKLSALLTSISTRVGGSPLFQLTLFNLKPPKKKKLTPNVLSYKSDQRIFSKLPSCSWSSGDP